MRSTGCSAMPASALCSAASDFLGMFACGSSAALKPSLAAPRGQERLREAAKLGFKAALLPKANMPKKSDAALHKALAGMTLHPVERIEDALELARGF